MEFRENQAIYLQIAELMAENILTGKWKEQDRIPSIRELSAMIEVNPNTTMRAYGYLQEQGVLQNERGIGYFVAPGGHERTRELMRRNFVSRDLPRVFRTMELLQIAQTELAELYASYRNNREARS